MRNQYQRACQIAVLLGDNMVTSGELKALVSLTSNSSQYSLDNLIVDDAANADNSGAL